MSWLGREKHSKESQPSKSSGVDVWIDIWAWADVLAAGRQGCMEPGKGAWGAWGLRGQPDAPPRHPSLCCLAPGPPTILWSSRGSWSGASARVRVCIPMWPCQAVLPGQLASPLISLCLRSAGWAVLGGERLPGLLEMEGCPPSSWGCSSEPRQRQKHMLEQSPKLPPE